MARKKSSYEFNPDDVEGCKPPVPAKIPYGTPMSHSERNAYNKAWSDLGDWYHGKEMMKRTYAFHKHVENTAKTIEIEDKLIKLGYCI